MKILWVEDQVEDNMSFYRILGRRGDSVTHASTVQEAIVALRDDLFETVVLDLKIPLGEGPDVEDAEDSDFNGKHVLSHLQSEGLLEIVRVVCLTNFWEMAAEELKFYNVEIVRKAIYLSDLEKVIHGD